MGLLKPFGLMLLLTLCFSCSKDEGSEVVFYSKDQLISDLPIKTNVLDGGAAITLNSESILSMSSSEFVVSNLEYLKDIDVVKMSYKIKNLKSNFSVSVSSIEIYLDNELISPFMGDYVLNTDNNNIDFEITDAALLATISNHLMTDKEVQISLKSGSAMSHALDFDLEFQIDTKSTFVD